MDRATLPIVRCISLAIGILALLVYGASDSQAVDAPASAPAKAELGKPVSLSLVTGTNTLRGGDARTQLLVDAKFGGGQIRDISTEVKYEATPPGIVNVDASGFVVPLADGKATVRAIGPDGIAAEAPITVEKFNDQPPINFPNEITPIFTKLGCNAGGCHGKSSGQNGFRLSLLGFYPTDDYEFLTKEGRGRRVFPAAPERSLLLLKPTATLPHGGGRRLEPDSLEYRRIYRWIAQGMPYGKPSDPTVDRIEVVPRQRTMATHAQQQLAVRAYYTDGSVQDVTRLARFEANVADMAEVSPTGLVRTADLAGDVAVMLRYQGQVDVFEVSIPLGAPVESLPKPRNFIDELVFAKFKTLGLPPSDACDDPTFLRRVTISITGRLPTIEEAKQFLADTDSAKREKLIDRLLDSPSYAQYFAGKWSSVLRNKRVNDRYTRGNFVMYDWLRESLQVNKPYDQLVREIIGATGELSQNPAVVWYRAVPTASEEVEDTAQLFLGTRVQCARCHHHPFERWSQKDYYSLSAFFSQVRRKNGLEMKSEEVRIVHERGEAKATDPRSGQVLKPAGLGATPVRLSPDDDPRQALVDWMVAPQNPFFAKALVNRYWKHFFGRGLVEPEDDMRLTNPATNPQLLDALARHFADCKYDLKDLIRTICQSQTFQRSAVPNAHNGSDKQNFSRYYPRRLSAEVLYDAVSDVTGSPSEFKGMPSGTRAIQLPDNSASNYFLGVFGKPQNDSACECERSSDATLAQTLHMINSGEIQRKLSGDTARLARIAGDVKAADPEVIRELYLATYSREPSAEEHSSCAAYLANPRHQNSRRQAFEDVLWALLNSKEFLFNH